MHLVSDRGRMNLGSLTPDPVILTSLMSEAWVEKNEKARYLL